MPLKIRIFFFFFFTSSNPILFFRGREPEQKERQRYINCSHNTTESLMYSNGSRIVNVSLDTLTTVRLLLCSQIQLNVFKDLLWSERSAAFSCALVEY